MTRKTKNTKNPDAVPALTWLLLAGGALALGLFLLRPEEPAPVALAPSIARARARPLAARPASEPVALSIPPSVPSAPSEPALVASVEPVVPRVHAGRRLWRRPVEAPWRLPVVGLSPDPAWALTPEQRGQFEKLSHVFLDETADPAISREEWARARASSDADFRLFLGDSLFFAQQHRVALRDADAVASEPLPTSDQP